MGKFWKNFTNIFELKFSVFFTWFEMFWTAFINCSNLLRIFKFKCSKSKHSGNFVSKFPIRFGIKCGANILKNIINILVKKNKVNTMEFRGDFMKIFLDCWCIKFYLLNLKSVLAHKSVSEIIKMHINSEIVTNHNFANIS